MADLRLHPPADREPKREPSEFESSVRSNPKLLAEGWVRRNLADPARAEEMTELYRSLGYEVQAVKLTPEDFGPCCQDCASEICRSYVVIYTRKQG